MTAPERARLTQPEMSQCTNERELSHAAADKAYLVGYDDGWVQGQLDEINLDSENKALTEGYNKACQEAKEAAAGLVGLGPLPENFRYLSGGPGPLYGAGWNAALEAVQEALDEALVPWHQWAGSDSS